MKLGRILVDGPDGGVARLVMVRPDENRVVDLKTAERLRLLAQGASESSALALAEAQFPGSMRAAIGTGEQFLPACQQAFDSSGDDASFGIDDVTWIAASDPSVVRDGLTFIDHIRDMAVKMNNPVHPSLLKIPGYFKGSPHTCIGHDQEVVWPEYLKRMDYELEIGWVIGCPAHNITPETARAHLFGLTIFNDFSGRDLQMVEMPIGMGPTKGKDFAYGIGPWITTIDEFDDLDAIRMEVRVNGESWAKGTSANRLWSVEELIAWVALDEYAQPGDVIGSGTMGKGSSIELGRELNPGDIIELEVEGIGVLRNRLGLKQPRPWWPTPRQAFT